MTIDQPKATMIAAGIMAVGAITVALINKKASDKPMIPKAKAAPVVSVWREIWPSVLVLAFSIFMLVQSFISIAPYFQSKAPATSATIVLGFNYGIAVVVFACLAGWSGSGIWRTIRRRR